MVRGLSPKKRIGALLFPKYSKLIEKLNWNARWIAELNAAGDVQHFGVRPELHEFVCKSAGPGPIDYMEFGVWKGASMKMWVEMNTHPGSRFYGFDSFRGLPEDWGAYPKGTCDVAGKLPDISDSRLKFIAGWFQDTMPGFLAEFEPRDRPLIVHIDADLYSSTLYCLSMLDRVMRPGTVLIFDEFGDVVDEYRALLDYSSAYLRSFKITGGTKGFVNTSVELTK